MRQDIKRMISPDENIYYEGKPNKKCFIFESVFNPMMPIAIVWAIIDFGIIGGSLIGGMGAEGFFMIPFFALHLMPVWIYLGGVIFSAKKYANTYYIVTDRAIYISGGIFTQTVNMKPFAELSHINLHIGVFDKIFGVGDIIASTNQFNSKGKNLTVNINSIDNYMEVYNIVKKLQIDIYSDIMYPNAKRPPENPGYNTRYRG